MIEIDDPEWRRQHDNTEWQRALDGGGLMLIVAVALIAGFWWLLG